MATASNGNWINKNGELRIDSDRRDPSGFFNLKWTRKNDWEIRWRLATRGEDVEAEIQVFGPDTDRGATGPPDLLGDIFRRYPCRLLGETPVNDVVEITAENADWYADALVFNPERRIPVVALSEGLSSETTESAANALSMLQGLATVATYTDQDLVAINIRLGRLVCLGGEVHVYRPGGVTGRSPDTPPEVASKRGELERCWRQNATSGKRDMNRAFMS